MPALPDVVVIGNGLAGSAVSRALAASGAQVSVIDRGGTIGQAWSASAGMLAAQIEADPESPLFTLGLAGRGFFRRQAASLQEETGVDIAMTDAGILQLVYDASQIDHAKDRVASQRQQGQRADWLAGAEVAHAYPWLAPVAGAIWSPDDGSVDPGRLVASFRAAASRCRASMIEDAAIGLDISRGKLQGVLGERGRYPAGIVVIANGAWSGRLENLPRPLSVEPVRGQMIAYPWPAHIKPAVVYGRDCYLLPRNGEMLVGATMEHAGFDHRVTAEGIAELRRRATETYPDLANVTPTRSWAGLRPGTPDGLPIIGPEPRLAGLWYAAGHGRNGVLLSGITGEIVARGVAGEPIGDEIHPFRPERFWNW